MRRMVGLGVSFLLLVSPAVATAGDGTLVTYIEPDDTTGMSQAAVVGACALLHTTQLLPVDRSGRIVAEGDVGRQIDAVLSSLETALTDSGAEFGQLVKINAYLARIDGVAAVKAHFARRFRTRAKPAVSFVVTALPHPGALVALDAVAALPDAPPSPAVTLRHLDVLGGIAEAAHAAILPPGDVVYVSGQSEPGDLPEATAATVRSLIRTIQLLGLDRTHIVQLKAFMQPMEGAPAVYEALARVFAGQRVPPVSLVEWRSDLPTEIELIAFAPSKPARDSVSYITPPGIPPSPVYSRVTRVHGGKRVYIAGLYAGRQRDAAGQIHDIFGSLKRVVAAAGTDLRHLVKATYYASDAESVRQLNELRPHYYDPHRPPATSKAIVKSVGLPGRTVTMNMIAVTPQ